MPSPRRSIFTKPTGSRSSFSHWITVRSGIDAGSMGTTVLNVDGVKALASLPSLDELRAKIVGLLVAPATKLAQLANAPAAKLARVIQAHASKSEAA